MLFFSGFSDFPRCKELTDCFHSSPMEMSPCQKSKKTFIKLSHIRHKIAS
jgi:hypothetical protein